MRKSDLVFVLIAIVVLIFLASWATKEPLVDQADTPWRRGNTEDNMSQTGTSDAQIPLETRQQYAREHNPSP